MENSRLSPLSQKLVKVAILGCMALLVAVHPVFAQAGSPWENAVTLLQTSFTGPLARGLSLVAIVIGGLMFAFGEGQSKRVFASLIFGLGIALGAVNFMSWLFGVA